MAPADDYSTGGGGKLKLKGSKVADGRVKKKKKDSKKKKEELEGKDVVGNDSDNGPIERREDEKSKSPDHEKDEREGGPKTETERKYEEVRRKRVCIE
jgi:protein FAM32A